MVSEPYQNLIIIVTFFLISLDKKRVRMHAHNACPQFSIIKFSLANQLEASFTQSQAGRPDDFVKKNRPK
jgi:hypothetical protein